MMSLEGLDSAFLQSTKTVCEWIIITHLMRISMNSRMFTTSLGGVFAGSESKLWHSFSASESLSFS